VSSTGTPGAGARRVLVVTRAVLAAWLLCAATAAALHLASWSRPPLALERAVALETDQILLQPLLLPAQGIDRLGLVFSKRGDPWPATVQVWLVDGDRPPRTPAELAQRTLLHTELRVHGDVDRELLWRPVERVQSRTGDARALLLVQRHDRRSSTLELWLQGSDAWLPETAQRLGPGSTAPPASEALPGAVALLLGGGPLRALRHAAWLGLWLLGLTAGLLLWWQRLARAQGAASTPAVTTERWADRGSALVVALAALAVAATTGRAGIAWDEQGLAAYGGFLREYYGHWFPDAVVADHNPLFNLYLYGGAMELALALLDPVLPLAPWDARHLLTGLVGVAGLLATRALARHAGGPRVALWAVLLLALLPSYSGHWLNNTKDIPFAVGFTWALVAMARCLRRLPVVEPRAALLLALVMGLTMAVRVAGVLLPGLLLLLVLAHGVPRRRGGTPSPTGRAELPSTLLGLWLPASACAVVVMLLLWPWAQQDPLRHPLRALVDFGSFATYTDRVLLAGQAYLATEVPRSYLPSYLLVKLPELHLLLLGLALALGARVAWRRRLALVDGERSWALIAAAVVLPVLGAALLRPHLYDELRQFLFVLPALCVVAAGALDAALGWAWRRSRAVTAGLAALCALLLVDVAWSTSQLAPYHYAYYNRLAGGVRGAQDRYELDYWGLCLRQAVSELEHVVAARSVAASAAQPLRVATCGERSSAETFFPSTWQWVPDVETASFVLTHRRDTCRWQRSGRSVARVERAGVVLCEVREVTP
jgi:hypothetical protein